MNGQTITKNVELPSGEIFVLQIHAWIRWEGENAYVEGDTLDFDFADPDEATAENFEKICKFLDENFDTFRTQLEEKAEECGPPIGWNA